MPIELDAVRVPQSVWTLTNQGNIFCPAGNPEAELNYFIDTNPPFLPILSAVPIRLPQSVTSKAHTSAFVFSITSWLRFQGDCI